MRLIDSFVVRRDLLIGFLLVVSWQLVGCTDSSGPSGNEFLMSSPPAEEPVDVLALKSQIQGGATDDSPQTLIGAVGGNLEENWDQKSVSFLLRDRSIPLPASHEHGGHDDNCKFCQAEKAKQLESMVLVQLVQADGQTVSGDPRKVLGLKENQTVIAKGLGEVDSGGTFLFRATQIYVQP